MRAKRALLQNAVASANKEVLEISPNLVGIIDTILSGHADKVFIAVGTRSSRLIIIVLCNRATIQT